MTDSVDEANLILQQFKKEGINYYELGLKLQNDGAESFSKSWEHLIESIKAKRNKI